MQYRIDIYSDVLKHQIELTISLPVCPMIGDVIEIADYQRRNLESFGFTGFLFLVQFKIIAEVGIVILKCRQFTGEDLYLLNQKG